MVHLLLRLWHLLRHGPEIWRLGRQIKKMRQGHEALALGLAAVAAGDAVEAGRLAVAARKQIGITVATQLLQAQAAQLAGDDRVAGEIFQALTEDPASAVIGYRGLIMAARRTKDVAEMVRLADALQRLKPKTPWLSLIRFDIAVQQQNWAAAGSALAAKTTERLLGAVRTRRARAALLIVRSEDEAQSGNTKESLQAAEQAARQEPEWLPAVINLAQRLVVGGHQRAARRVIERQWAREPHPRLAALYGAAEDEPMESFRRIERLCRAEDEAPASHMALAEAALRADLWGAARRHLMILVARHRATQATYRLLARLERRESGNEQAAMQWLTKAVDAAPDPTWLCRSCGEAHQDWQVSCRSCGGFVTLEWRGAGISSVSSRVPIPMNPLLGEDSL